ncbi:hypothetical protein RJ639_045999 [Escallonia herrerae]|uniref:Uncharacterized protein n=1 Tax=Escallonia herrerae TaxID=1293975 RepID=A0AA88W5A9_9ASTE|nr:hypothetical protein RJ639_045999 [Escallonia herrerae]
MVYLSRASANQAEQWVNNMTKSVEDESTEVVLEARPPRLGLGAAVPRQSHFAPSNDPVERKLRAKLDAEKRKVAKIAEESTRDESVDEDSAEESESRTKAFSRKRAVNLTSSLQANKRQK